jgi:hypothetical protein
LLQVSEGKCNPIGPCDIATSVRLKQGHDLCLPLREQKMQEPNQIVNFSIRERPDPSPEPVWGKEIEPGRIPAQVSKGSVP